MFLSCFYTSFFLIIPDAFPLGFQLLDMKVKSLYFMFAVFNVNLIYFHVGGCLGSNKSQNNTFSHRGHHLLHEISRVRFNAF